MSLYPAWLSPESLKLKPEVRPALPSSLSPSVPHLSGPPCLLSTYHPQTAPHSSPSTSPCKSSPLNVWASGGLRKPLYIHSPQTPWLSIQIYRNNDLSHSSVTYEINNKLMYQVCTSSCRANVLGHQTQLLMRARNKQALHQEGNQNNELASWQCSLSKTLTLKNTPDSH
jgi:hypothetical protein